MAKPKPIKLILITQPFLQSGRTDGQQLKLAKLQNQIIIKLVA
jgi:hypothetical protein